MNSKKINKLIIVCILFIIICLVILLFLILNKDNNTLISKEQPKVVDEKYEVNRGKAQSIDKKYIKEPNEYNHIEIKATTQERVINEYLEHYKEEALNYISDAYESLDEQFKKAKFNSLEEYKQYINNNRSELENVKLNKYKINEYNNDYTEYICQDQYDNYYIFHVTNPGNYTVILDTYTVDLPEFTEKYNKVNAQEKVALNINKVITALNDKDYKYIYNKLADSFKDNYFNNEEELKEYLSNKLYNNNEINFGKFSDEGNGIYTYEIELSEISNENEAAQEGKGDNFARIKMNVVMQLKEGTDFVMSFSIE